MAPAGIFLDQRPVPAVRPVSTCPREKIKCGRRHGANGHDSVTSDEATHAIGKKSQAVPRLADEMQGTAVGITLAEMRERFTVSRSTAERMRKAVGAVFPQAEQFDIGDGVKRWRIPSRRGMPVTPDELATLHGPADKLRQDGCRDQAEMMDGVVAKLRALLSSRSSLSTSYGAFHLIKRPSRDPSSNECS